MTPAAKRGRSGISAEVSIVGGRCEVKKEEEEEEEKKRDKGCRVRWWGYRAAGWVMRYRLIGAERGSKR